MSVVEDAWKEVKAILIADITLKSYIKNVFEGVREDIPHQAYPCIILEPKSEPEEVTLHRRHIDFGISIHGLVLIHNVDKQIVGDVKIKGIVDVARDIKNALEQKPNLNGKCISFKFPSTEYAYDSYPIREVEITMEIQLITATATGR